MRDFSPTWQQILSQGFASARELLLFLNLPEELGSLAAEKQFKTRVPRAFAQLMEPGNRLDPLLLQVLPVNEELIANQDYLLDALQEKDANPVPGIIHKYPGRILVTLGGACAVHCRYCFRRHFPYEDNHPVKRGWGRLIEYIENDTSLYEVILSGGDPLMAKNPMIADFISQLAAIPHLHTIRIHSRIPVVLPERIDEAFCSVLSKNRLKKVMVFHSNHARELDYRVETAAQRLKNAGCTLLNQSVLLTGVNDNAKILADLSMRLFAIDVQPYYLHLLDKVQGAAHFDMTETKAKAIFKELQTLLPGYLVPRLVREEVGKKHKTLIV